jgi:hypothetical protein
MGDTYIQSLTPSPLNSNGTGFSKYSPWRQLLGQQSI